MKNNTAKKTYEEPKIEIVLFSTDVISTSDPNEGEWDPQGVNLDL